jgi:CubicO group peptidase (beta-lactamase class C family)
MFKQLFLKIYALIGCLFFVSPASSQDILTKLDSAIKVADKIIETDNRVFFRNVESLIVYFQGNIIFEKYYNGYPKDSLHQIQSQTKSIVALLMGIAIDHGFIKDENVPVSVYFPEYFDTGDNLKSRLAVKDLLTMSSGFEWEEMIPLDDPKNDNINMFRSNSWLKYVLSRPMAKESFTEFKYNSGCPMIVAGIIEKSTNMLLEDFANKYLFVPLGISEYSWIKDSTGFCHAGGGLFLRPKDMLKIGILVLNKGKWDNRKIVSENWIQKATQSYFLTSFDNSGYGYFWWVREMLTNKAKTTNVISAEGAGGQKLYIFNEYNLVVAFTERNYRTPQVGPLFIKETILKSLD